MQAFNNKQPWNDNKCRCECKELIDKGLCDKEFVWNRSNCESGCDKSCDVGEYLDYENCKCREKIADKLVEECTDTFEEKKIAKNMHKCDCCTLYIALFSIILQLMLKLAFILFIFTGA